MEPVFCMGSEHGGHGTPIKMGGSVGFLLKSNGVWEMFILTTESSSVDFRMKTAMAYGVSDLPVGMFDCWTVVMFARKPTICMDFLFKLSLVQARSFIVQAQHVVDRVHSVNCSNQHMQHRS